MELTKYKIGELIELTNEKNANGLYGEDDAIGVNIDKIIMPMRGNLEKKDFSNFHLVPPRHFAYNPRGSRKLGIGFNDTEKTFIITFNDNVFRIKETAKKKILDTYLFMYLCRKEWDRYAEFISWGSSTEVFDWNIFCEEEIFLPPIQIQQKYVDVYNAMLENQKSYEHGLDDLKLSFEEVGEAQEQASEDIIKIATEQALAILRQMNENRESFRKIGLTFEEKAFYDILISLRDQYNFEYGTDKEVDGVIVNDKCKALAKKIKDIIDTKSSFADWLNNQNVRNGLKLEIKICLVKNGYPPQYSPEVFNKVMEQVENFEEYSVTEGIGSEATTSGKIYEYEPEYKVMMVAEDSVEYGKE